MLQLKKIIIETLIATSNSSTLKQNKDQQKSVKERRSRSQSHEILILKMFKN